MENTLKQYFSSNLFSIYLFFTLLENFFYFSWARQFLSAVFFVELIEHYIQFYLYLSDGLLNIISMLLDMHADYTTRKISLCY